MYKAYLFDLDGTIIDSLETIANCFNSVLVEYGFKKIETKLFNYLVGEGPKVLTDKAFEYLVQRDNLEISEIEIENLKKDFLEKYLIKYDNMSDNSSKVYSGIKESLDYLKENNKKIAICTNKPAKAAKSVLDINFGKNYFDYIQGLEDYNLRKPNPFMVNKVVEILKVKKTEVVYFGDTSTDMQTAKNAGVLAVGVLWGFREKEELVEFGADKILENPLKIKEI